MVLRQRTLVIASGLMLLAAGCALRGDKCIPYGDDCYDIPTLPSSCQSLLDIEDAVDDCCANEWREVGNPMQISEDSLQAGNLRHLTLEQAVNLAMQHTKLMRDLGLTVLRNPDSLQTVLGPSLAYSDPRFGEEAALSQFDAQLQASAIFENNDRGFNSTVTGLNGQFRQDLHDYRWGISKTTASGGKVAFRQFAGYDFNNSPAKRTDFAVAWDTYIEGELRHPLLQGAGTEFNRIAGPNAQPGAINGVLIARTRTDISLADFEVAVRDMVANVENAYWDLYYAYRDLDAKIRARDQALSNWRKTQERSEKGLTEASNADQAREQYFRFQAEVVDALNGKVLDATRTNNGSSGGTFRAVGGIRTAERRLRLITGMEINDGLLVYPSDSPSMVPITYDWDASIGESLTKRPELRRQRWVIKQAQLVLTGNKNFLSPRLDTVAKYRLRGFSDSLDSASDYLNGDQDEWQLGLEFSVPIGYRQAHAAVRNSELKLAREREVLKEQERAVHFGLSNAIGELRRSHDVMLLQYDRREATRDQIQKMENKEEMGAGTVPLDVLLEAQRRLLDADLRFFQSQIEYALAIRNVHFEKGSLLERCNIFLAESVWPQKANQDAADRVNLRSEGSEPRQRDTTISRGPAL
jgi:outer membrane protein TolC